MIRGRIDVEQRHGDLLEVHLPAADLEFAFHELVALVEVPDELPQAFARLARAVKYPFLHSDEVQQLLLVLRHIQHPHVLADIQGEGHQHEKANVHEVSGNDSVGVDECVDIQIPGPAVQQPVHLSRSRSESRA